MDWDNFGFGLRPTDAMYVMKCEHDGHWGKGELKPFGNLELSPSAAVLNYGQVSHIDIVHVQFRLCLPYKTEPYHDLGVLFIERIMSYDTRQSFFQSYCFCT